MENESLKAAFKHVREVSFSLSSASDSERRDAIISLKNALSANKEYIFAENEKDLREAEGSLSDAVMHRLRFSSDKLDSVIKGLEEIALLPDPIGRIREKRELDPGFILEKRTFPIGVIGMIFEARPDALVQIAGLALRSGNAIILKGGKEAGHSNAALYEVIRKATAQYSFGSDWIYLLKSHSDVDELLKADGDVDLLIPRGSNAFVRYVMDHTRIPVMGHADGICSVYVDEYADLDCALKVAIDSKVQYPAACNAAETILVHRAIASSFIPLFGKAAAAAGVIIHASHDAAAFLDEYVPATEDDFHKEYLALECAIRIVDSEEEAIKHINGHGSHHTDAIVTQDENAKRIFFMTVDSADVFANCSTRFADGFRFGLGAEVGISTSKLHARGPVGLEGLTTTKWILSGNGETVAEYSGKDGKSFHHKELI